MDVDDYRPFIRSKHPVMMKSQDRRNPSPNVTVRYEDEKAVRIGRRAYGGRSLAEDNHSEVCSE